MSEPVEGAIFLEGVYLPAQEKHLIDWMVRGKKAVRIKNKITYQWGKQEAAMKVATERGFISRKRDTAMLDVGAHCALWSMWWAPLVNRIYAFEPIPLYRHIYKAQMQLNGYSNYTLFPQAVSDVAGTPIQMRVDPTNTGGTRAYAPGEQHDVETVATTTMTIDMADYKPTIGVFKIDCEGYEEKVINGARKTLEKHRPMVIVEQKFETKHFGFQRKGAVRALEAMGYVQHSEIGGDHIMLPT